MRPAKEPQPKIRDSEEAGESPRRISIFVSIISTVVLLADAFVFATWDHFRALPAIPLWQFLAALLTVSFVPATLLGLRRTDPFLRLWYRASAASLGVLSFAVVAAVACWIFYAFTAPFGVRLDMRPLAAGVFGLAALASVYGIVNAARVRITRMTVALPNLPDAWLGRTAVLLSDLHLGNMRGAAFARRIVTQVQRLHPDAIFISGDLFDGVVTNLDGLVSPFTAFAAPAGVYYVTGNHEEFTDRTKYIEAVVHTGIRVLNNEKVVVDGLQIVGAHDSEATNPDALREVLRSANLDRQQASILIAHQPAALSVAEPAGISLQLSGHTHAGQFWPWSLLIGRAHGRFAYGLNPVGNLQVLTTSGTGTWGPPLRVGTKSEMVVLTFA